MLFSIKSENLKLASRSRDYTRKSTIETLKTCQPREQNMQLSCETLFVSRPKQRIFIGPDETDVWETVTFEK